VYLLQSLIIGAVVVHNEYNHWTPNKVLANAIGIGLAYLATLAMVRLREFCQRHVTADCPEKVRAQHE
jgi:hypothetical protein